MDVFGLRERVVDAYSRYVKSFLAIRDPEIRRFVEAFLAEGRLWPEPLVQLNPAFEPGTTIDELAAEGVLHPECKRIFRRDKSEASLGFPLTLHKHQEEAIRVAKTGGSYVLTTGTGSGKSLAYFVPIIDHVLRAGSGQGIRAIVVYPMNALCNSQMEELRKFLLLGYPEGQPPVRFARYTGQESDQERQRIIDSPPDILLTNFVMLELILTRPGYDRKVVEAAQGLEFLVLDELHTYRGRQGADVAMLARRIRERCGSPTMRCVGTSATVAGSGSREQRQAEVASVAGRLFGLPVHPTHVIGETLRRATIRRTPPGQDADALREVLAAPPRAYPTQYPVLSHYPLAVWAEEALGLQEDERGRLERRMPRTLASAAEELSSLTGIDLRRCREHLQALLMAGYRAANPETGFPLFAFRLHQFVSRGDTIYSSPEPWPDRHLSAEGQLYAPGDRQKRLFPLAFCRECGQDFFVVDRLSEGRSEGRDLSQRSDEEGTVSGFLMLDPRESCQADDPAVLPEDWVERKRDGELGIRTSTRKQIPQRVLVLPDGRLVAEEDPDAEAATLAWFMPAPFRFCPSCGVTYSSGRERDFGKLAELATEGRSTATTILSLSIVQSLRETDLPKSARKLLSFTDNRQDASLQAGHFNDFVQVGLLRSALLAAVAQAGPGGLGHDTIAQQVTDYLGLDFAEYASNPEAQFLQRKHTTTALRDVVGYRIYRDLRRGWRVTAPNLEQCGLLEIEYDSLRELCEAEEVWKNRHRFLAEAGAAGREKVCQAVLNHMRRELAIKVPYLDADGQESLKNRSYQYLVPPWSIEESEQLEEAPVFRLGGIDRNLQRRQTSLTAASLLGRYLRRATTWPDSMEKGERLRTADFDPLARDLMEALVVGGQVEAVPGVEGGYLLQAGALRWKAGDGLHTHHDPVRIPNAPSATLGPNASSPTSTGSPPATWRAYPPGSTPPRCPQA